MGRKACFVQAQCAVVSPTSRCAVRTTCALSQNPPALVPRSVARAQRRATTATPMPAAATTMATLQPPVLYLRTQWMHVQRSRTRPCATAMTAARTMRPRAQARPMRWLLSAQTPHTQTSPRVRLLTAQAPAACGHRRPLQHAIWTRAQTVQLSVRLVVRTLLLRVARRRKRKLVRLRL